MSSVKVFVDRGKRNGNFLLWATNNKAKSKLAHTKQSSSKIHLHLQCIFTSRLCLLVQCDRIDTKKQFGKKLKPLPSNTRNTSFRINILISSMELASFCVGEATQTYLYNYEETAVISDLFMAKRQHSSCR